MENQSEKRSKSLAEHVNRTIRSEREPKFMTDHPETKSDEAPKPERTTPSPLDIRLELLHKMKREKLQEQKKRRSSIDEFLDSEENQKKYGFTTEVVNGIRNIYYDGDMEVLNNAMYGPRIEEEDPYFDPKRTIRLSLFEGRLYASLPGVNEEIPTDIRIGPADSEIAYFSIVSEQGLTLTQLCLTDPAYYPDEDACRYVIDMRGLSALNSYMRNNFHLMIEEWNRLHPSLMLDLDIPMPNYRFLASEGYQKEAQ